jgi:hypothetical protein
VGRAITLGGEKKSKRSNKLMPKIEQRKSKAITVKKQ